MLTNPFQRLIGTKESIKTYDLVRDMGRSYRLIKNYLNTILKKDELSSLEWGLLGLLYKNKEGMRYVELAQSMGVEPPFITELISALTRQKLVQYRDSDKNKRAKIVSLTEKGEVKVELIEKKLEESFLSKFAHISNNEWSKYGSVIKQIITQIETENKLNQ